MRELPDIVRAYDIRGLVGIEFDAEIAHALGVAFARFAGGEGSQPPGHRGEGSPPPNGAARIVVGRDMRSSSPELAAAFAAGITATGTDVVDIGLVCTDAVYWASGAWSVPGAMFTASHNPADYNGIKLCLSGARPVGADTGLATIADGARAVLRGDGGDLGSHPGHSPPASRAGSRTARDVLADYASHLRSLVELSGNRPLKVVADAGNGMAGLVVPVVFAATPVEIVGLYFELDGTFPNHEPNPIEPENLRDLARTVREVGADLGLAFDGDADRCFVVDETGTAISPSAVSSLIAERELRREPGAVIVHNLITSRALPDLVSELGGKPVRTRVGHSFIKAVMAEHDAIFGGEHSGHYYFRDFWFADSGMLAALHLLAALGETPAGTRCSQLLAGYERYCSSGELNSVVIDPPATLAALRAHWAELPGAELDELDGLTVTLSDGAWFNVRPSNTEPKLRCNVEAPDAVRLAALRDEVLGQIRSGPKGGS